MRRGVGHYFRKGLGGTGTAVRRFGGTSATATKLYGALSALAGGRAAEPGSPLDPKLLAGKAAGEVLDAVVEAVRPTDGTQDTEASRTAIADALSELLHKYPEADLLNLSDEQRLLVIAEFVALDVFHRFCLDVGKVIKSRAKTARDAMARLKEVKNYIREVVAATFRKASTAITRMTRQRIRGVVQSSLREAIEVFQEDVS